jgi:hypothetical protein
MPKGPPNENYLEGLVCWLSHIHEGSYWPILQELQQCLGEEMLPLTKWANHEDVVPPPSLLSQNYPLCQEWMECKGFEWNEPESLAMLQFPHKLSSHLVDPSLHSHGTPPSLLTCMEDYNPYVATTMGAFRQPRPASLQERHVQPQASNLTYPGEELEPYVDDDLPPGPNFTRPEEANLVTLIVQAPPQEDNADVIQGPLDE